MKKEYNRYGFEFIEQKRVPEINADGILLKHTASGATLFKVVTEDSNNTFCITFKTTPQDDSGIPHILEHSVLNGSEKFPVKSPFATLMQGSLNTFLNALTGKDRTMYPVASKNRKDFFNLMDVYLDAVFNPMIHKNPMIFRQEGWHTSFDQNNTPEYNGVVYSEMKGAFSSPATLHSRYIYKALFPTTTYGTVSGGYPEAITELKEEDFLNFHKRYYHPSNSMIYLYGNGELEQELEFIHTNYLSKFEKQIVTDPVEIPLEPPISTPVEVQGEYPISPEENPVNKTTLSSSWVCNIPPEDVMGLDMLTTLLSNLPSSPLRKALIEAGCGEDTYTSFSHLKQSVVNIVMKNSSEEKSALFRDTIQKTLEDIVKNGFDPLAVEGVINRYEFDLREGESGSFPKAIEYCYSVLSGWYYFDNPFEGLEFAERIAAIREEKRYFEELIDKYLIKNNHRCDVVLAPSVDAEIISKSSPPVTEDEARQLQQEYKDLLEYQNTPDKEEDLAKIPMLSLKDLPSEPDFYKPAIINERELEYHSFTGGLLYPQLMFDASSLNRELVPYLSLLTTLLGELDTEKKKYDELDSEINIHTGGISFSTRIYTMSSDPDNFIPFLSVSSRLFSGKFDKFIEITKEILFKTVFKDIKRIRELSGRLLSRYESLIRAQGYTIASGIFEAELGKAFMFRELIEGISFYDFLKKFNASITSNSEVHIEKLKIVMKQVINKKNLTSFITGASGDCSDIRASLGKFRDGLPERDYGKSDIILTPSLKNIALSAPSQVQYVFRGCNFLKHGYTFDGISPLLSQIIGRDYMHHKIRVNGGAYGAIASIKRFGIISFSSYRDPNLDQTVETIRGIPDYLKTLNLSESALTRFKTGTIAKTDRHLNPQEQGKAALENFFKKVNFEDSCTEREALLAADMATIKEYAETFRTLEKNSITVVYGKDSVIRGSSEHFDEVLPLLTEDKR